MASSSLGLDVKVTRGYNQVQRLLGSYRALYTQDAAKVLDYFTELAPGDTFSSKPGEITSTLVISTSERLAFNGVFVASGSINFVISKALVLDDALSQYHVTNTGTAVARVFVNEVSRSANQPLSPVYYGTAVRPAQFSSAFIQSLILSSGTAKNQTISVNAATNQRIYYCYPAIQGLSQFTVGGLSGGIDLVAATLVPINIGPTEYYVYESANAGLGQTTVVIGD